MRKLFEKRITFASFTKNQSKNWLQVDSEILVVNAKSSFKKSSQCKIKDLLTGCLGVYVDSSPDRLPSILWPEKMSRYVEVIEDGTSFEKLNEHRRHRTCIDLPLIMIHNKALNSFCHAKIGGNGKKMKPKELTIFNGRIYWLFPYSVRDSSSSRLTS